MMCWRKPPVQDAVEVSAAETGFGERRRPLVPAYALLVPISQDALESPSVVRRSVWVRWVERPVVRPGRVGRAAPACYQSGVAEACRTLFGSPQLRLRQTARRLAVAEEVWRQMKRDLVAGPCPLDQDPIQTQIESSLQSPRRALSA